MFIKIMVESSKMNLPNKCIKDKDIPKNLNFNYKTYN